MADSEINKSSGGVIQMVNCGGGVQTYGGCGCGDSGGDGGEGKLPDGKQDQLGGSDFNAKCVEGQLVLSWSMSGYVSFKLYRGNQVIEQGGPEKTSYTDSTAEPGKTYTYTLELRKNLTSTDAPEKKQLTASLDNLNCTNDATLTITAACDNNKVKLTWTAIEGAYYSLEYTGYAGKLTETEYVDDSLTSGQTRQYTVRAYRLSDTSGSNELASDTATVVYDDVCQEETPQTGDCSQAEWVRVYDKSNVYNWEHGSSQNWEFVFTVTLDFDITAFCGATVTLEPTNDDYSTYADSNVSNHVTGKIINNRTLQVSWNQRENASGGTWEIRLSQVSVVRASTT